MDGLKLTSLLRKCRDETWGKKKPSASQSKASVDVTATFGGKKFMGNLGKFSKVRTNE